MSPTGVSYEANLDKATPLRWTWWEGPRRKTRLLWPVSGCHSSSSRNNRRSQTDQPTSSQWVWQHTPTPLPGQSTSTQRACNQLESPTKWSQLTAQ
jgi:hypothetical protein